MISVVIVAAGSGTRMKSSVDKMYIKLANKPVIARTIEVFEKCDLIDEIIVVVKSENIPEFKRYIIDKYTFCKVKCVVAGGKERQDSVYNGLQTVDEKCNIVVVHDGARPFVSNDVIDRSIIAAKEFGAAAVGVRVKDTLKQVDDDGFVKHTPDRSMFWHIQTPQTFNYELLMYSYQKAFEDGFYGTDDCMLVERIGKKVKIIEGSYFNIKITTAEDVSIASAII